MALTQDEAAKLDALQMAYQQALKAIRADRRYTPEGRQAVIAKLYRDTSAKMKALTDKAKAAEADRRAAAQRRLFPPAGSDPSAVISMRDAMDRVDRITKAPEAEALLARAIRSGDTVLQRAILEKAIRGYLADPLAGKTAVTNWGATIDMYSDANPGDAADVDEYIRSSGRGDLTQRIMDQTRTSVSMPTEIGSLTTQAIDGLAKQATEPVAQTYNYTYVGGE